MTAKFRAWDGEKFWYSDSPNAEFVFGGKGNGVYLNGELQFDLTEDNIHRFTGLFDKNGTKIFEGDVVKDGWKGSVKVVEWKNIIAYDDAQEWVAGVGFDLFAISEDDLNTLELIGNVYENPELINKEK